MTTGNTLTDVFVIWLPVVLAVVMGIIGLLRGTRREAVVSISIVLAALIMSVWGTPWATDLHSMFSGVSQADTQNILGIIVFLLIALVIGYGLGSALVQRGRLAPMSRLGGLLIGLANGAALGGWILRNYYNSLLTDLTGPNVTSLNQLNDNIIPHALIIWAGWFPLALALAAAIVALIGPFRKAQTAVATPSAQSDWAPSTAPAIAPTTVGAVPSSYTPQYPQQQYPQQQYGQQQYPQQQYTPQFGPPQQPSQPLYNQPSYAPPPALTPTSSNQPTTRVEDAPPTMPMPVSDVPRPAASVGGQDTVFMGQASSSAVGSTFTPSTGRSARNTGPLGDPPAEVKSAIPAWAQPPDSSWLSAPRSTTSGDSTSSATDSSRIARSEAPTSAYPVTSGTTPPLSASTFNPTGTVTCSRCGTVNSADATFCVECGNRLKD
ncbi:MAG: CvpA family protein [Chloroflexota bacterium]